MYSNKTQIIFRISYKRFKIFDIIAIMKKKFNSPAEFTNKLKKEFKNLLLHFKKDKKEKNSIFLGFFSTYIKVVSEYDGLLEVLSNSKDILTLSKRNFKEMVQLKNSLGKLKEEIKDNLILIFEETKKEKEAPILAKVIKEYNLDFNDTLCLALILLRHSPFDFPYFHNYFLSEDLYSRISDLSKTGLSIKEIFWFFDKDRKHIKDEFIVFEKQNPEAEISALTNFHIPMPILLALLDCKLKEEDLLSISETALFDLVSPKKYKFLKKSSQEYLEEGINKVRNDEVQEKDLKKDKEFITLRPFSSNLDYINEYLKYIEVLLDY